MSVTPWLQTTGNASYTEWVRSNGMRIDNVFNQPLSLTAFIERIRKYEDGTIEETQLNAISIPISSLSPSELANASTVETLLSAIIYTRVNELYGASTPSFSPIPGTYQDSIPVNITILNPNAQIYYTTDGSIPTSASTLYTGTITITANTNFQAVAIFGSFTGAVVAANYVITPSS